MKPISEFIVTIDAAESKFKKVVLEAFKSIDEGKVEFISTYNEARLAMEADVAQREQSLRDTVAKAVEALNGDAETEEKPKKLSAAAPMETQPNGDSLVAFERDPTGGSA